jgi:hypothetical protein
MYERGVSDEIQRYLQRRRAEALDHAKRADERAERACDEGDDAGARSYEAVADRQRAIARTYEQRIEELAKPPRPGEA